MSSEKKTEGQKKYSKRRKKFFREDLNVKIGGNVSRFPYFLMSEFYFVVYIKNYLLVIEIKGDVLRYGVAATSAFLLRF